MSRVPAALVLAALLWTPTVALGASEEAGEPSRLVVHFDEMPGDLAAGSAWNGGRVLAVDTALRFAVVEGAGPTLASLPEGILSVEPDAPLHLTDVSVTDALFPSQYAPGHVRAPAAWDDSMGETATICIVDTGVRHTHEDLKGPRWLGGTDLVNDDDDPWDDNGHGTHVAGIAAATIGNGVGIAGIAGRAGFYAVKALDAEGSGHTSDVASGIRWCADKGARVISLSLGSSTPASSLASAVSYAWQKGSLLLSASGNTGPCTDCVHYPAAYPKVMAVACTTKARDACRFSSGGAEVSLAAPGHQIVSTWSTGDSDYKSISGTSMSTPAVAGVAALVASAAPGLTNAQLRAALESSATDLGADGRDVVFGHGLVDAARAIAVAKGAPAPEPAPAPPRSPVDVPAPTRGVVANAGGDLIAPDGDGSGSEKVRLDGSNSTSAAGIASYEWTQGARVLATKATPAVVFPVGTHRVTLTVTDANGAKARDIVRVDVPANRAPTAAIAASCERTACAFDASRSVDRDGTIVSYEWSFGDGSANATGASATHEYASGKPHTVHLTVTDDAGKRATTSYVAWPRSSQRG